MTMSDYLTHEKVRKERLSAILLELVELQEVSQENAKALLANVERQVQLLVDLDVILRQKGARQ